MLQSSRLFYYFYHVFTLWMITWLWWKILDPYAMLNTYLKSRYFPIFPINSRRDTSQNFSPYQGPRSTKCNFCLTTKWYSSSFPLYCYWRSCCSKRAVLYFVWESCVLIDKPLITSNYSGYTSLFFSYSSHSYFSHSYSSHIFEQACFL